MEKRQYDGIVIGSGQGGKPLAVELANAGWKMAIVEKGEVGGVCINYGCTPTKTMIASARAAHLAQRGADYGVNTGETSVDLAVVRERKRKIVTEFRAGSEAGIHRTTGLELIRGVASFEGSDSLRVEQNDGPELLISAPKIFINVGGRPAIPDLPGLETVDYLNSSRILELGEVPEKLLVLGGGYIGLEFGQMFRRFGSEVTILQRGEYLLEREDEDVSIEVQSILAGEGVEFVLGMRASGVAKSAAGGVMLRYEQGGETKEISGSHLLVSVGRRPNSDSLNLDAAGLKTDARGYIPVNDRLETDVSGIYALGDITGGPAFTHLSYDDYRIVFNNLLGDGSRHTGDRLVPYTMFIDPQLARVGLSEAQATAQGIDFAVAKMPLTHVARAIEVDETRGFIKALVDPKTKQILGCAVLSIEGGELMTVLQMAMENGAPYTKLRDGIFAHPTLSEALNNLFAGL